MASKLIEYCPRCGETELAGTLEYKVNRTTGHEFIGCSNWPFCEYTELLDDEESMQDKILEDGGEEYWK